MTETKKIESTGNVMSNKSLRPLALTFVFSGIWDTIAAVMYLFFIGSGRLIDSPPTDSFYSIFLGSFFICFAWLQFLSATNIERYAFVVGGLIIGRLFYVIQLYAFMALVNDFPNTFWFTGIIDMTFILLYVITAQRGGLSIRKLFIPTFK